MRRKERKGTGKRREREREEWPKKKKEKEKKKKHGKNIKSKEKRRCSKENDYYTYISTFNIVFNFSSNRSFFLLLIFSL